MPSVSETDLSPVIESLPYIDISELESEESDYIYMPGMALWQTRWAGCIHCLHTTCTTHARRVRDRLVTSHRVSAVYRNKWAWERRKWLHIYARNGTVTISPSWLPIACIQHAPHMPSVSETDLLPVNKSLPYIDISELESEESD